MPPRASRFSSEPGKVNTAISYYEFAEDAGAIGAIELPGVLPLGAVVTGGFVDVLTTFITAGADAGTIALHIQAANDLVTATAVSAGGNIWDAGVHDIVPDATGSTAIKLTADRQVVLTIGGQVVTAGKLAVVLEYVMSPNFDIEENT